MVLYFSGTGNSKRIAGLLAEGLNEELFSINDGLKYGAKFTSDDKRLVVVSPVYSWRLPKTVGKWLAENVLGEHEVYFALTCGDEIGNAEKYLKKYCRKNGLIFKGIAQIIMPENYIVMFDCPSVDECRRIIAEAENGLGGLIEKIKNGEALPSRKVGLMDKLKSGIVNDCFYTFYVSARKFKVVGECVSCGKCVTVCPLNNVKLVDGKPKWGKACTHCMSCMCNCPKEAIEYGKNSVGKRKYLFSKNY